MSIEVISTLSGIARNDWNALAGDDPFLKHEFLSALHETGCATADTGWLPQYVILRQAGALVGALPLYLKSHSYGEYVFDWAWADAYSRHGLDYYPKLVSAVPFTPVTGRRLLAESPAHRRLLVDAALALARDLDASSLHFLFPDASDARFLGERGLMLRHGVQFHWTNSGYADFDDFLARMSHAKRKNIRQERRRVREAGIDYETREGGSITDSDWQFFTRCYQRTYRAHHSSPYLNLDFFRQIGRTMPQTLVLIIAQRNGRRIAASLNVHNGRQLFGRYWGCLEYHPALHFETCYYRVIEYCIARSIEVFEGGAQGEHKMARGLLPVSTASAHWLAHP
ncbi:MAG TPA: GNAT family N-acetyltransferase, partial [Burkholderiales bacterium]|nr:GNAT family N-acetyltransferase [Burkholderiales bacterium]